jgi:hypothetical protein
VNVVVPQTTELKTDGSLVLTFPPASVTAVNVELAQLRQQQELGSAGREKTTPLPVDLPEPPVSVIALDID